MDWRSLSKSDKADLVRARIEAGDGSAGQIAKSLGVSRNVVIGVVSRNDIKLPGDRTVQKRATREHIRKTKGPPKPKPAPKPKAVAASPKPKPAPLPAVISGKPFIDLQPGDCKWPLWKTLPSPASSAPHCGRPVEGEGRYCTHHAAKAKLRTAA